MSGPRIGATYLGSELVDRINEEFGEIDPNTGEVSERIDPSFPVVSQFGWQFERRLIQSRRGLTVMSEFVPLIGGLERGLFLPSMSFLVGLRAPSGLEVGVGPNVSLGGAGYAVAAGVNQDLGEFSVPVTLAAVFSDDGPRVSFLVGLTIASGRQ
jgi:hypothetical protein